jgi:non-ribosomal peptide synthetase component F
MLALRSEVDGNLSFIELLKQVRTTTMEAYENQEVPFEKVVDEVVRTRDMNRNPLFQVMFVLRNIPDLPEFKIGEIKLSGEHFEHTTTHFDLTLFVTEGPEGLKGFI